jgi:hypothetical protein
MHSIGWSRLVVVLAVVASCVDRSAPAATAAVTCPVTSHDFRVDSGTIGGLSVRSTIAEIRHACPTARADTVGVGGTQPAALSIAVPGVVVGAVQTGHDAYGDSLHEREVADLWVASGDSLRFPDGTLIPRRVGALRRLDADGVIVVDHGDDGTGSYIARCKYPWLQLVVDNMWPSFADSGAVRFAKAETNDTTQIWRVEVNPTPVERRVARLCAVARVP